MALSISFMAALGTLIPNGPHELGVFENRPRRKCGGSSTRSGRKPGEVHLNQRLSTSFKRVWVSIARLNALLNSMGISAR